MDQEEIHNSQKQQSWMRMDPIQEIQRIQRTPQDMSAGCLDYDQSHPHNNDSMGGSSPIKRQFNSMIGQEEKQKNIAGRLELLGSLGLENSQDAEEISEVEKIGQPFSRAIQYRASEVELSGYNYDLSDVPPSVTPLLYSKNSRKQVRFRKGNARFIILKLRLTQSRETLSHIHSDLSRLRQTIAKQYTQLSDRLCQRIFQVWGCYSMRTQQSLFLQKQEYQTLKYQYEIMKGREDTMKALVQSELVIQSHTQLETEAKKQAEESKDKTSMYIQAFRKKDVSIMDDNKQIQFLRKQRDRLTQELSILREQVRIFPSQKQQLSLQFKRKISQIEQKTSQIRLSNDKLYEYIFDLQQKIAYQGEQLPALEMRLKQEFHHQKEGLMLKIQELEQENQRLKGKYAQSQQQIASAVQQTTSKISEMAKNIEQLKGQLQCQQQVLLQKQRQAKQKQQEIKSLQGEIQRAKLEPFRNRESDRRQSNLGRQSRQYQSRMRQFSSTQPIDKPDRRLDALQIQRLVLHKQNLQLKATIQYMSKQPSYGRLSSASELPQSYQKQRQLQLKQRELKHYQGFVQGQMRKLQTKQRQIQSNQLIRRVQQYRPQPALNLADDYGMNRVAVNHYRSPTRHTNQFCSGQTQAIIEKVKMRQKFKDNSYNNDSRNGHSRDSEDSRSYRGDHYRPPPSPVRMNDYLVGEKNAKMKLIQDKVRRLKSELKTSLTSMK